MRSRIALAVFAASALAGCAAISGYLGARPLQHAPYYHTWAGPAVPREAVVAHLPITWDVIVADVDAAGIRMLQPLLDAMNGYLDAAGWSTRLDSAPARERDGPWAYVGTPSSLADAERARSFFVRDADPADAPMVIQARQASEAWRAELAAIAAARHADYVLCIRLGAAQYGVRHRGGLSLRKAIDIGTNYTIGVSWLTDQSESVPVIHLVGLLLSREGRVLRAGSEGLLVQPQHPLLSALNVRSEIANEDVASLLASRHREDLPGQPLVWETALQNLVGQLLGRL